MKYRPFAMTYLKNEFRPEESIDVDVHTEFIDIQKHYQYGSYIKGFQSMSMSIETAKQLRDKLIGALKDG